MSPRHRHVDALVLGGLALASATAHSEPVRDHFAAAVDVYAANVGGETTAAIADVATSIVYEHGGPEDRFGLRFDLVDRESMIGGGPRRELHELNVTFGRAKDPISARFGRQRVVGGFWLFADGVALRHAITKATRIDVVAGLRAFSNARAELVLRRRPIALPLVALSATRTTARSQLGASIVATRDVVTLGRGFAPSLGAFEGSGVTPGAPIVASYVLPEVFVDVSALAQPSSTLTLFGGATAGNRYEVELSPRPDLLIDDPTVHPRLLRSFGGFAAVDHRPSKRHQFLWSANAVLAKTKFEVTGDDAVRPSASFLELGARYRFRATPALRITAGNRLRRRDGDLVERPTLGVVLGQPARTSIVVETGVDLRFGSPRGEGFAARRSWVVNASIQQRAGELDARAGIHYADALPGSQVDRLREDAPVELQLFPYTLEAQRFAYARTHLQLGHWSVGCDLEWALEHVQLRALVQIGYAR
jgi:hypothetical protein